MKKDTGVDLKKLKKYIIKHYGQRCKCVTLGCICCQAWEIYDWLKQVVEF